MVFGKTQMSADRILQLKFHRQAQISFVLLIFILLSNCGYAKDLKIKKPVVAGGFYPGEKQVLLNQINRFLKDADIDESKIKGDIIGLISPHAGYIYSGPVTAHGFKLLQGRKFDTVLVIAPSHYVYFKGLATGDWDFYRTPLGDISVDKKSIKELMSNSGLLNYNPEAFLKEHSLEVQLPFLQKVLSDFKLLPLVVGKLSKEDIYNFSRTLEDFIDKKDVLIVASSDLCHYLPYAKANSQDKSTIDAIKTLDVEEFYKKETEGRVQLCGKGPVMILMSLAKNLGLEPKVLKYANSGDTAGDKTRVVGYASMVFTKTVDKSENERKEDMLDETQKKKLLDIARDTIEGYVKTKKIQEFNESDPRLLKEEGAFVTLHKGKDLRGCIGNIYGKGPLYLTIRNMAIESAIRDPRFSPVESVELSDIDIEISVLSVPEKISDINKIVMGRHGVIVKKGLNSGVFLPQVATETGWNREEFLSYLCSHKAGLSPDAWKSKDIDIYIFTAQVFSEKDF